MRDVRVSDDTLVDIAEVITLNAVKTETKIFCVVGPRWLPVFCTKVLGR